MNKDRVEGKVKDAAGRVERQVGEWTGDPEKQVEGAAKQVECKVQNAWGKAKDATKTNPPAKRPEPASSEVETEESAALRRKA